MSAVERMAQAMHREHSRNPQYDYDSLARAALTALAGSGMEEAVEAAKDAWRKAGDLDGPDTSIGLAWHKALQAAAPLLLAKPLQENELLRVALGAANDDREAAHERLAQVRAYLVAECDAAHAEVARVTAERDMLTAKFVMFSGDLARSESQRDALAAENTRLREALGKYGRHTKLCGYHTTQERTCTCDLLSLLTGADR